ncbi:MAG: UvrD-helicase domain-containing protein [bacterium]|nr:UvrD-helicase domain-containing protein [bacterium]
MSDMRWTKDQQKVIEAHKRNLLVSAAAGSGKTAVLVQRIVEMIANPEAPMDVDELLVVTFTKAAAAEMKERVGAALEALLEEHPQDRHLRRQNTLIHQAQITTIDSFCLYVIRNYFNQLDIDPAFRIGDEGELRLLLADVMEEMLEEYYQSQDEDFGEFVEAYSRGKTDAGIDEYIYQVHTFAQSTPWPKEWMAKCRLELEAKSEEELEQQPWMEYLFMDVRRQAEEALDLVAEAKELCMEDDGPEAYLEAFSDDEALIERILDAAKETNPDFSRLNELLAGVGSLSRLKAIRSKTVSAEKKEEASRIRAQIKSILGKLKKVYAVGNTEEVFAAMQGCSRAIVTLLRLAEDFTDRYQAAKKEKNLVDFSDLEHFALEILLREPTEEERANPKLWMVEGRVPSEAARQLASQYREILIDEYQDSNLVQETLLRSISREGEGSPNLFMVGDVKQSIYRFRLARPELFMQKYASYSKEDSLYQKIELHQNFRSRREVLESANQVFWRLMIASIGGIRYTEEQALHVGAEFAPIESEGQAEESVWDYRTELLLCDTTEATKPAAVEKEEEGKEETEGKKRQRNKVSESKLAEDKEEFTAKEAEAHMIAKKIREITDPETGMLVWDKKQKKYRRARYQDIAILSRAITGWAEICSNVLLNSGIPAVAETRTGYFTAVEVETILSFLAVLDNPMQDIPLAAVLHSPIGALSDRELAVLMAAFKQMPDRGQDRGLYAAYAAAIYGISKKEESQEEEERSKQLLAAFAEQEEGEFGDMLSSIEKDTAKKGTLTEQADENEEEEVDSQEERCFPVLEETIREKLLKVEALFVRLRAAASYLPIHELLYMIFEETGYYRYVQAMPAGQVRAANLDMLAEKAAAYEATSYRGVFHFIRYIEKLKKYDTDFGEAALSGEEDNAVRIMSIHKSKGLEFPIVFLAGMAKKFNKMDLRKKVLIDPEMGIAADYMNLEKRVRFATLKKQVLKRRMEVENLGEELRVLYVAMTRAKEKLFLTAALSGLEKRIEKWVGKNQNEMLFTTVGAADSYLDWILMSLPGEMGEILSSQNEGKKQKFGWLTLQNLPLTELVESEVEQQVERKIRKEELLNFDTEKEYHAELQEHLEQVMHFVYPHEEDITLHTKIAVSELKKKTYQMDVEEAEFLPSSPEFLKRSMNDEDAEEEDSKKMSKDKDTVDKRRTREENMARGAERGTMYHHVLELLPMQELSFVASEKEVEDWVLLQVQNLVLEGKLSKEEEKIVEARPLARFLLSALGRRMRQAAKEGRLQKEKQFVMGMVAKELPGFANSDEYVVIQGVVDAWFEEDGKVILVDYKTDRVRKRDGESILAERYQTQLDYYEKALAKITKKTVAEKWLYSFSLGKEIKLK